MDSDNMYQQLLHFTSRIGMDIGCPPNAQAGYSYAYYDILDVPFEAEPTKHLLLAPSLPTIDLPYCLNVNPLSHVKLDDMVRFRKSDEEYGRFSRLVAQ